MEYNILATGSSGNATIINGHILIDCGVSRKKIKPYVRELDVVLLTHVHSDHFNPRTVSGLHKSRPALRFACCEWMVQPLLMSGVNPRVIDVLETGSTYAYTSFFVKPFPLVHNVPNCGYMLFENDERMVYATDTGSLDGIEAPNFDLYLIEANHSEAELDARMSAKLEAGVYSYEAAAALNHLSKEQALEWLAANMGPESRYVFMHQHVDHGGNQNGMVRSAPDDGAAP